eukprot:11421435-Alexandrium_andersonii.AAC.1
MTIIALFGTAWIRFVEAHFASTRPRCLADDVLLQTSDARADIPLADHVGEHTDAVTATVRFVADMQAVLSP